MVKHNNHGVMNLILMKYVIMIGDGIAKFQILQIHVLTILWEGVNMADIILHFNVEEYIEHYVLQISESTHMDIQIFLL